MSEAEIKSKLLQVQSLIANLTSNLSKAEAIRDSLIRQLSDHEGCHDRRFAVR